MDSLTKAVSDWKRRGKDGQGDMQERWSDQLIMDDNRAPEVDGDGRYCPECGQSLHLTYHQKAPVKRRAREPLIFLIFGLYLTIAYGLRTWNAAAQFSSLDQQIAALSARAEVTRGILPRPGNPPMIVSDTMGEVLEEQLDLRLSFQSGLAGLGLGLFTLVVGSVTWLSERSEIVSGQRKHKGAQDLPSLGHRQVRGGPWNLGGLVAITLVRMVLLLFVTIIGLQLIRGTPLSLQLLDQTLTRMTEIAETIAGVLS